MTQEGVSIIIPVYNGGELFLKCLEGIRNQDFIGDIDLIVVDSGSSDDSVLVAKSFGATVSRIENKKFHHSRTRNDALKLAKHERIVFFVQDAIPASNKWLSDLYHSLDDSNIVATSVRQIPHLDADLIARFEIEFHGDYLGNKQRIQSIESPDKFSKLPYDEALHTIRNDNVCAIYRRSALIHCPFPDIEFAEDMAWAHEILMRGNKILYNPQILIMHSHNRPPAYRFKRAIVDSIACAKILGRVKEDISYLTTTEVIEIKNSILAFTEGQKTRFKLQNSFATPKVDISNIYLKTKKIAPFIKKILVGCGSIKTRLKEGHSHHPIQSKYAQHIAFIMSMIAGKYSFSSSDSYSYCIDQITSSCIGRIYGEYYSGHMLRGAVPSEVKDLVEPYRKGV